MGVLDVVVWYAPPFDAVADMADLLAVRQYGLGFKLYSILSHLAAVPFIVRAIMLRNYLGIGIMPLIVLVSMVYHACQVADWCLGMLLTQVRQFDKLTASLAVILVGWLVLLALGSRTTKTRLLGFAMGMLPLQLILVGLAVMVRPFETFPVVVAGFAVAIQFLYYYTIVRVEPYSKTAELTHYRYHPALMLGGLMITAIAITLFLMRDITSIMHSNWHTFIFLGLAILQEGTFYYNNTTNGSDGGPSLPIKEEAGEDETSLSA
jgi:hypothetical protein